MFKPYGKRVKFRIKGVGKDSVILGNWMAEQAKAKARSLDKETPGIVLLYIKSPGSEIVIDFKVDTQQKGGGKNTV